MKYPTHCVLLFFLCVAALGPSLRAAAFQNGSFETNAGNGVSFATGWTITGGSNGVQTRTDEGTTAGMYAMVFNNNSTPATGVLYQAFNTTSGKTYQVTLDFGSFANNTTSSLLMQVQGGSRTTTTGGTDLINSGSGSINTTTGGSLTLNTTSVQVSDSTGIGANINAPAPNDEFSTVSFLFTATSGTATIFFTDKSTGGNDNTDAVLDNVAIGLAPEPTTWTLLGVGMAGLGLVTLRRRARRA